MSRLAEPSAHTQLGDDCNPIGAIWSLAKEAVDA